MGYIEGRRFDQAIVDAVFDRIRIAGERGLERARVEVELEALGLGQAGKWRVIERMQRLRMVKVEERDEGNGKIEFIVAE